MNTLIKGAFIVNEGQTKVADVLIRDGRIDQIGPSLNPRERCEEIQAEGLFLLPGVIDDQVHFREPGLTHKACIASESRAAVAGGVTSYMEMPNTKPPSLTQDLLEQKYEIARSVSPANYSFYMGVSNDNADEALRTNEKKETVCGLKIFMGSSTGNMLVDNFITLDRIFSGSELLIATHCEDEKVIATRMEKFPHADRASFHPLIRDEEACFESSFTAVQLAKKHHTRLHILHITTAKELQLFTNMLPLEEKRITSEVCVHHLHFTSEDYARFNNLIKCNPAIKDPHHRDALWKAVLDDTIDVIATDHAPHTWEEKQQPYPQAPAGLPLIQHPLLLMLDYVKSSKISIEKMVDKMSHRVARCFQIRDRGFIREGYWADLVLVDLNQETLVRKDHLLYRCAWSPFEGHRFSSTIRRTWVNGQTVWDGLSVIDQPAGQRLLFNR